MIFRTSAAHEEGGAREFSLATKRFSGDAEGNVRKLHAVLLDWHDGADGQKAMTEVPGSEFEIEADLVLLAMVFTGPERGALLRDLGVELDPRGAIAANERYQTNVEGVFACGDARRGQSLVVWAIWEGREAARQIDALLTGHTDLPSTPMR
jgi:glutamate synthase (NADPH/NADH) small chain